MQEEEARLRPGTNKAIIFQVLKQAGIGGMTVQQIKETAEAQGLKRFDDTYKSSLSSVRFILIRDHVH